MLEGEVKENGVEKKEDRMRFLVKATIPVEAGNALVRDPNFSKRTWPRRPHPLSRQRRNTLRETGRLVRDVPPELARRLDEVRRAPGHKA